MFTKKSALCLALMSAMSIGTATAAKETLTPSKKTSVALASEITTSVSKSAVSYFVVPSVTGAAPYAGSLTITQLSSGTQWSLTAGFTNLNAKVLDLDFDYTGSLKLTPTNVSGGGEIKQMFNKGIQFEASKNTFAAGETMTWEFVGTDLSKFDVNALHIGNFLTGGESIKYGVGAYTPSPVPEPSTYFMVMVGGLAVWIGARRRKLARPATSGATSFSFA